MVCILIGHFVFWWLQSVLFVRQGWQTCWSVLAGHQVTVRLSWDSSRERERERNNEQNIWLNIEISFKLLFKLKALHKRQLHFLLFYREFWFVSYGFLPPIFGSIWFYNALAMSQSLWRFTLNRVRSSLLHKVHRLVKLSGRWPEETVHCGPHRAPTVQRYWFSTTESALQIRNSHCQVHILNFDELRDNSNNFLKFHFYRAPLSTRTVCDLQLQK